MVWLDMFVLNSKINFPKNSVSKLSEAKVSYFLGLILIFAFLAIKNFPYNSWFTGWDNLHPEFNFWLNTKRAIFAVWQENQGLGTFGGHGYAATLPHTLFLFFLSFFIPLKYLRSTFTFFTLISGSLGAYFLVRKILNENENSLKNMAAFLAALFYLLNFGTIQNFHIQLEAFIIHYACLPWLFYCLLNFLEKKTKRSLLAFSLITFLSTPQGFIPPLFLVYFLFLLVFLLFYVIEKKDLKRIKEVAIIILVTLAINAYWLLPVSYYSLTRSSVYLNAYNNLASTEDFILKGKKYGNLTDVILLRGFLSETKDVSREGQLISIFGPWLRHFEKKQVVYLGYLYFGVILAGALSFILKKTRRLYLAFLLVLIISFSFLATNFLPFSLISRFFETIPIFKQAFRAAFTKFSVSLSLFYSVFFGIGLYLLLSNLRERFKIRIIQYVIFFIFCSSLIYFAFPVFTGNLFYKRIEVNIPKVYLELFEFFQQKDKKARIVNLPQGWNWGWSIYKWGYSGSGFLWYGIEQPILDRAFDVWGEENENYHWEINYALYSQNKELFEKVLEKYQINWLLLDGNIIYPSSPKELYLDELEDLILVSEKVKLLQEFGKIKIYQVKLDAPIKDFVFLAQNLPAIGPAYDWNNCDLAYADNKNYVSQTENAQYDFYYPFRSLFSGRSQEDLEFKVEDKGEYFIFKQEIPESLSDSSLIIPEEENKELVWIDPNDLSNTHYLKPEIKIENQEIKVKVPKVRGYFSADINSAEVIKDQSRNCNQFTQGKVSNETIEEDKKLLRLTAIDANNCSASFWLPSLPHKYAYLIAAENRHVKGKSFLFWLENLNSRRADIETYLPKQSKVITSYFVQPPMEKGGLEYTLHFDNISIGRQESINDLGRVSVNPIPYNFLTEIKLVNKKLVNNPQLVAPSSVLHPNPSFYHIKRGPIDNQILILSQAFHPGWQAYEANKNIPSFLMPFLSKRINKHILINNWENGWILDNQNKIAIIFLPQYLEYFGFLLLLIPVVLLLIF